MAKVGRFALTVLAVAVLAGVGFTAIQVPPEYLELRAADSRITFYYHPRDVRAARYLSNGTSRILERIGGIFDDDLSDFSCRVIVAGSVDDYERIDPSAPSWSAGRAYSGQRTVVVLSGRAAKEAGRRVDPDKLLAHELFHLIVHERVRADLPRYFEEGLARYVAGELGLGTMATLSIALVRGDFIPLGQLVSTFPLPPERAKLAYAESESFVWFLIDRYGPEFLGHLFVALEREREFARAIEMLTGTPLWELEQKWRGFLANHHTVFIVLNPGWLLWWLILAIMIGVGIYKLVQSRRRLREMEEEDLREAFGSVDRGGKIIPFDPDSKKRRDKAFRN